MSDASKPIALVVYAQTGASLSQLGEEARNLRRALRSSLDCEPLLVPAATIEDVIAELQLKQCRDRVVIFHYAGHANGEGVILRSAEGPEEERSKGQLAYIEGLVGILKQQKQLKLVFLNGCSTAAQVDLLREAGIPAVIATTRGIDDAIASQFAMAFYESLDEDHDLQDAFEAAESVVKATEGGQTRTAFVEDFDGEADHWPWKLHGDKKALAWKLRDSSLELGPSLWNPNQYPINDSSPYLGLRRFNEEDQAKFFGRDRLVMELLEASEESGILMVVGPSGSGKSSVVRAGMVPQWRETNGKGGKALVMRPGKDPFERLYIALCANDYSEDVAEMVREASPEIIRQAAIQLRQDGEPWLLFIDQFEECFTLIPESKDGAHLLRMFVAALTDVAKWNDPGVRIVLAMRDDFFSSLGQYRELSAITDQHLHRVTSMDRAMLREVIERPAAEHGVGMESGLTAEIIREVEGRPGMLPLLQYTLNALWEKDDVTDRVLNVESYRLLGGVRGALRNRVTAFYEKLPGREHDALRRVMLRLVEIDEKKAGAQASSRPASIDEFDSETDARLIERLIEEKLLVSSSDGGSPEASRRRTVELAHEALIGAWPQFNEWIKDSRNAISVRNRLSEDCGRWKEKQNTAEAEEELLTGSRLALVLEMLNDGSLDLIGGVNDEERAFILASQSARDRKEKLRRKVRRLWVTAVSALAVGATIATFVATRKQREAEIETGKAWLERARSYDEKPGHEFWSSIMAARALGFQGYGRADMNPQFRKSLPVYLRPGEADARSAKALIAKHRSAARPIGRSPAGAHLEPVSRVFFSSDGKTLATLSNDKVNLWDLRTGNNRGALTHETGSNATCIDISSDGQFVMIGYGDGTVGIWRFESGALSLESTMKAHPSSLIDLKFATSRHQFTTVSANEIGLWERKDGFELSRRIPKTDAVRTLAHASFDPEGRSLAINPGPGEPLFWHYEAEDSPRSVPRPQRDDEPLAFSVAGGLSGASVPPEITPVIAVSPNGKMLARSLSPTEVYSYPAVKYTYDIEIWDLEERNSPKTLEAAHESEITSLAFSPDGDTLASGSKDEYVKFWELEEIWSHELPGPETIIGQHTAIESLAFSPDGRSLAVGSSENIATVWGLEHEGSPSILGSYNAGSSNYDFDPLCLALSPDGKVLAGSYADALVLWDLETYSERVVLNHTVRYASLSFSSDGQTLACSSERNTVKLLSVSDGTVLKTLVGHTSDVTGLAFSPDGKTLASGSRDHTIKLWSVGDGLVLKTLNGHQSQVASVAISPDGKTLASGSEDNTVKLWSVVDGALLKTLAGHQSKVASVAFSPDGKTLASGSDDQTIRLWDMKTDGFRELKGHRRGVQSVKFFPDGKSMASKVVGDGLFSNTRLWDLQSGESMTLTGHDVSGALTLPVESDTLAVSADGSVLVTNTSPHTIEIWNLPTGDPSLGEYVGNGWFRLDGRTIAWTQEARPTSFEERFEFQNVFTGSHIGILQSGNSREHIDAALFWAYVRARNWHGALAIFPSLTVSSNRQKAWRVLSEWAEREADEVWRYGVSKGIADLRKEQIKVMQSERAPAGGATPESEVNR